MIGPGLTSEEAAARLRGEGSNLLPGAEPATWGALLKAVLAEPMLLMLLGSGAVYLLLGDTREALTMISFILLIIGISFAEARKTHRALEALRDLSAPRAMVIRDGVAMRIPGREVVRGDLLVLHEGDRVPADARLLEGLIEVDESLLTGESVAVLKGAGGASTLFASTLVTKGFGWAEVEVTGGGTTVGRIGQSLVDTEEEPTPLQVASGRMVARLATLGGGLALAAFLLSWLWAGRGLLPSLLAGLTLAMAILPQEIPMVLTIFLAMGARHLSRLKVLTRRVPTVEALGAATVLAVDKTGTLTGNRMAVAELCANGSFLLVEGLQSLPETFHTLAEFSVLATPTDPFDPMEKALQRFGRATLKGTEHLHDGWSPEKAYELTPGLMAMSHVYRTDAPGRHLVAAKGAPEAIVDLCHLDAFAAEAIQGQVDTLARRGLRVLGVARGEWKGGLPSAQHDFDFEFLGLVGLLDPPRPEVPMALEECRRAGIHVMMLTGDHPFTAQAVAARIGMGQAAEVLTGAELDQLDDDVLSERLRRVAICARLRPEQKGRLVRLLKARGEVVAMTGDGVNDAPALKAAHIGVAMGERGTDVAREAAALVLLDDSFGALVGAIREGRRIYDNLARSMHFIVAVHLPVIGLSLVPLLLRWPPPLLPVHLALMEMLINPACSVVLESEPAAPGIMAHLPRRPDATPFRAGAMLRAALRGLGVLAILLSLQAVAVVQGLGPAGQRTRVFLPLVLCSFVQILAHRQSGRGPLGSLGRSNPRVLWTAAIVGLFLLLAGQWGTFQRLLELAPLTRGDLAWGAMAMGANLLWLELLAPFEPRDGQGG